MKRHRFYGDFLLFFVIAPVLCADDLSCAPVDDLPPSFDVIPAVRGQHIRVQSLHQPNSEAVLLRCIKRRHHIHLLDLLRILLRPGIILSGSIIGRIHLQPYIL